MKSYLPTIGTTLPAFRRLEREMNALMDRFLGRDDLDWDLGDRFSPRLNVAETDNAYEVTVDLPGLKASEINVEVRNGHLCISGERKAETHTEGKTFQRVERYYGRFHRVIPLATAVDESKISADYKDGVLSVHVPKAEAVQPKKITVKS
jgi:HSP20 family protein